MPSIVPRLTLARGGCANHSAATFLFPGGVIALGLPKGFQRFGRNEERNIEIFESFDSMVDLCPNVKTIFSVPIWKHLDANGNTIVRWFSPRTNAGWSNVILGDCRSKMPHATEITAEAIDQMD